MAKIGTAHIEIKPVVSDEALAEITKRVADAVAAGIAQGVMRPLPAIKPWIHTGSGTVSTGTTWITNAE